MNTPITYETRSANFFKANIDGVTLDMFNMDECLIGGTPAQGFAPPYMSVGWSHWPDRSTPQPDRLTFDQTVTTHGRTPDEFKAAVEGAIRRVARLALAADYGVIHAA